jgi:hypothetical protein
VFHDPLALSLYDVGSTSNFAKSPPIHAGGA